MGNGKKTPSNFSAESIVLKIEIVSQIVQVSKSNHIVNCWKKFSCKLEKLLKI